MEPSSGPRRDSLPPALPLRRMVTAMKVLAFFVGFFVFFVGFLPWAISLFVESEFCRLSPTDFCRQAGIERLAESSTELRKQFGATQESWRRLVASARG